MAAKSETQIRDELRTERAALADAVHDLRAELGAAADVSGRLRSKLPIVAAGAFGLGFFKAGGVGATMRLLFRRGREGEQKAKVGRFSLIDRG
ncbi:MAG TPA: hypothetical protein VFL60_02350 [Gaiellaceae bacterium]|nr:hypothetical protein [Gaiellaceae bacterium]